MDVVAVFNTALKHHMAGELDAAIGLYGDVLRDYPHLAIAHCNLGVALSALGRHDEAIASLETALRIDPAFTSSYVNLIPILRNIGRLEEAEAWGWRFLEAAPEDHTAYSMLTQILTEREKFEAAVHICRITPAAGQNTMGYWLSYGSALSSIGRRGAKLAVEAFRKAVAFSPERDLNHFGLAEALLRQGDCIEGWAEYAWVLPHHPFPQPVWKGEDPRGKTLLLYKNLGFAGGFGDVFHLVRYLPMVIARGARVVLSVPDSVTRLLAASFPFVTVVDSRLPPPAFDRHTTLMHLPGIMGTTQETIPAATPYIQALPADVERWRERLAGLKGLKVGLVWAGQRRLNEHGFEREDYRHTTLSKLERLLGVEGASFVSLQTGPQAREIGALANPAALLNPMGGVRDFADTAALISNLDLIISVDTSVAHLAGALGKPVWILLACNAQGWRWGLEEEESPWYPTAWLVRQKAPGAWTGAAQRVEAALREVVAGRRPLVR